MAIFYTADTHFCHERVISFCGRPFADVAAMHEALIGNWNRRVTNDDDVWVLGDFAFKNRAAEIEPLFHRLNGRKQLVVGNHDNAAVLRLPWASPPRDLVETREVIGETDYRLIMCHYPLRSWNGMYRGSVHLFGHEHGNIPNFHNTCDVGVDRWGFQPVTLTEIIERLSEAERNPLLRRHDLVSIGQTISTQSLDPLG